MSINNSQAVAMVAETIAADQITMTKSASCKVTGEIVGAVQPQPDQEVRPLHKLAAILGPGTAIMEAEQQVAAEQAQTQEAGAPIAKAK